MINNKVLLHVCCAPCAIMPIEELVGEGYEVTMLFVNPNIHPLMEYFRRRETLQEYAAKIGLAVIFLDERWDVANWLRDKYGNDSGENRCRLCYRERLDITASIAAQDGFRAFSSSLLYSKMQKHEVIVEEAERAAQKYGVEFLYRDFRGLWQDGINESKTQGMYRQNYCGCIYSEAERHAKKLKQFIISS